MSERDIAILRYIRITMQGLKTLHEDSNTYKDGFVDITLPCFRAVYLLYDICDSVINENRSVDNNKVAEEFDKLMHQGVKGEKNE